MNQKLASEAAELHRQIYASLPFTVRLAHLWLKLSFSDAELIGRLSYAIFLSLGVQGIPDIKGMPALEFAAKKGIRGPRDMTKVPTGVGQRFGRVAIGSVIKILPSFLRSTDAKDEIVGKVVEKLLKGEYNKPGLSGVPLKQAENYVIMALKNETRNYLRGQAYRQTTPMVNEEGEFLDFRNPEEFLEIAQDLTPGEIQRMFQELDQVGKGSRGSDYLRLLLEGYSQTDISRQLGVSIPAVTKWLRNNKQTIKGIIHKYLAA